MTIDAKIRFSEAIDLATNPLPGSTPERVLYKLTVKRKYEGLSIMDFFLQAVPRSKKELWEEKIRAKNITVNGGVVNADYCVKAGDLTSHLSEPKTEPKINTKIELIHEDENLLVLNKPAPLPVHASGRFARNTLIHILNLAFGETEFKLLHRLDANTTGVVMIAKNKETANSIRLQFEQHQIVKHYYALVEGIVDPTIKNASAKVGTEVLAGGSRNIDAAGKHANTKITVVREYPDRNQSLLMLEPETGRTNQIRLHLADLGYPIVGDIGYKDPEYFKWNPFTYAEDTLFLHAHSISLINPSTQKRVLFSAPLPAKFSI